jgi:hypothetical protein
VTRSGCRWIGALVGALAGSAIARADVVVDTGAPFTAGELRSALAIRQAAPAEVVVHVISPTSIELETSGGGLRIELGGARGVEAARLVALQWAALGEVAAPAPDVRAPPGLGEVAARPAPASPGVSGRSIGVAAGIGIGVAATDPTLAVLGGDVLWRQGHWVWGGGVTWLHGSTVASIDTTVGMDLGLARAEAGVAYGRFSALAGPDLVVFHSLSGRLGVGAAASSTINVDLISTEACRLFVRGELDVTLQSLDYAEPGANIATTPRFTASASLGAAWGDL